jgi:Na+-translocating ferredoxin:NAD+ oxidoreductase RnfC subunit
MSLTEQVRLAGVVGAGGGGFPAHIKLSAKAEIVIANGAECEPLLHKDAAVMEHQAHQVVRGVELTMQAVGATQGVIGIKAKKKQAIEAITAASSGTQVRIHLLGDYYPAGDEYDLVHAVTGRLIPPQGIPIQVGAVVQNVETLVNIAAAAEGRPVTHKIITLAGAVRHPVSLRVPIGMLYRDAIAVAGGMLADDSVLCIGGLMMGRISEELDTPITKTDTGAIVLPRSHPVVQRKLKPASVQARIGKSACDQCRYCTEFCPRYLLGYAVEPHQVMRSLAFTATGEAHWNQYAALCCACGLCSLYACPESLYPKEACDASKQALRAMDFKWSGAAPTQPHPMHDGRRTPIQSLMRKLSLEEYDHHVLLEDLQLQPDRLVLPLKQGAGVPNVPRVKAGDRVTAGQPLGEIPTGQMGSIIHAPVAALVESVSENITLKIIP